MRHDSHLVSRAGSTGDQQIARSVGHHDHELRLAAHGGEDLCLMRSRLREHRMQGDDERLRQALRQGGDVLAVTSPEDPVLVLEQDDVHVEPAQDPGRANVVSAHSLRDRCDEPGPLRARRLVHDHDLLDTVDPVDPE